MPKSDESLNNMLHDIKRISEHREKLTDQKIQAIYKTLEKELKSFVADTYEKYADGDGRLYTAYLDSQNQKANFLNEIAANFDEISPQIKQQIMTLANQTYERSYSGMVSAFKNADTAKKFEYMTKDIDVNSNVLNQAINNNVSKLTLPTVLEKHRAEIIYQIQQELNIGLMQGDRYEKMAKRISERIGVSQSKAMNITRTESHRNVESGFMDCAEHIQSGLDGSDLIYAATWCTMGDERVRPQQRRKSKKGKWKTTFSKNGANHMKMEGITVKAGDLFDLGGGVKAKAPSKSGVAAHDCNCRCFLEYNLMTLSEFKKATGKNVNTVATKDKVRQDMSDNGITDMGLERTTNESQFDVAINQAKNSNKNGGCVDVHPKDELEDFKLFLANDGMAGVAVKPDGDITAVFKNQNSDKRGAVNDLIITARENGGVKMDCYGQFLVNSYEKCGYVPVARIPFNAEHVDDPFLLKTKPDVYAMMKNTDSIEDVIKKNAKKGYKLSSQIDLDNLPTLTDYDEALKYRDLLLEKQTAGKVIDDATKRYTLSVVKEPKITADLSNAVNKTSGKLTGLDFRLKTESSYARKIEKEIIDINEATAKKRN